MEQVEGWRARHMRWRWAWKPRAEQKEQGAKAEQAKLKATKVEQKEKETTKVEQADLEISGGNRADTGYRENSLNGHGREH